MKANFCNKRDYCASIILYLKVLKFLPSNSYYYINKVHHKSDALIYDYFLLFERPSFTPLIESLTSFAVSLALPFV